MSRILSDCLLQDSDPTPLGPETSKTIRQALEASGFDAQDVGSHLSISVSEPPLKPAEFAIIYLDDDDEVLWIKALAQRWWLLFLLGDRNERFAQFWRAVDALPPMNYAVQQGTIGELDPKIVKAIARSLS